MQLMFHETIEHVPKAKVLEVPSCNAWQVTWQMNSGPLMAQRNRDREMGGGNCQDLKK